MARLKWNGRYAAEGEQWQNGRPRQLLLDYLAQLPVEGLALDAAAGVGVHGLALARRGLRVVALDISHVGLALGRAQARAEGLGERWATAVYDLSCPWFPSHCFDVIVNFRFLERATFAAYRRALKPGGWLIFETFIRTPETTTDVDFYLLPGELHAAFADFDLLHSAEVTAVGGRSGQFKPVAQLVARKKEIGD
jgi:tellurite methyltransferase